MEYSMNFNKETLYALWLLDAMGPGNIVSSRLCEKFDSFEEIYNASVHTLMETEGMTKHIAEKLNIKNMDNANIIAAKCDKLGIDIVTYYDVKYPSMLKNIPDFPLLLFVKGKLPVETDLCIAVVGSRKPSIYGNKMAESISCDLSKAGVTIVSGMARGVDSCAHRGALRAEGETIAVLGCGLDIVYPPENKDLKELIACNGAVISELVPETPPLPAYFPLRNRIVSGLSNGILVIEGKASSGSTITATLAAEQGRDVFCLPGNIDNPLSAAPNQLIRQGARLITCAKDILVDIAENNPEELIYTIYSEKAQKEKQNSRIDKLTADQKAVVSVLESSKPKHIDQICFESGIEIAVVNQCLFMLELEGIVKQLPGKQYILTI